MLYLLNVIFTTYTFMLMARVLGSWFPSFSRSKAMHFLGFYTDPYLNVFRKVIPPLGMMDLSPLVAFLALKLIQSIILSFLH